MPTTITAVTSSLLTLELLLSIIGCLMTLIICLLAFVFKNNIKALWTHSREQRLSLENHINDHKAHGIGELSVQIKHLDSGQKTMTDDIKSIKDMLVNHLISKQKD